MVQFLRTNGEEKILRERKGVYYIHVYKHMVLFIDETV